MRRLLSVLTKGFQKASKPDQKILDFEGSINEFLAARAELINRAQQEDSIVMDLSTIVGHAQDKVLSFVDLLMSSQAQDPKYKDIILTQMGRLPSSFQAKIQDKIDAITAQAKKDAAVLSAEASRASIELE